VAVQVHPAFAYNDAMRHAVKQKWLSFVETHFSHELKECKGSPYSITKPSVPELIPVLGSQPAGGVSQKLSVRPAITLATLKRAAASFAALWTEAQWV